MPSALCSRHSAGHEQACHARHAGRVQLVIVCVITLACLSMQQWERQIGGARHNLPMMRSGALKALLERLGVRMAAAQAPSAICRPHLTGKIML